MSQITITDVREGEHTLNDSSLDTLIPDFITNAEDLVIVQLGFLSDVEDLVRPDDPTDTPKAIDLLVLYKTREFSYNSYYGSLDNAQSKLWMQKYDEILKDIRKGYINIGSTSTTKSIATAVFG